MYGCEGHRQLHALRRSFQFSQQEGYRSALIRGATVHWLCLESLFERICLPEFVFTHDPPLRRLCIDDAVFDLWGTQREEQP